MEISIPGQTPNRRFEFHEGFEERLNKAGLLVRDWAPQTEILAHSSIGGFLSLIVREWDHKRDELVTGSTIDNVARKLIASKEGDVIMKRAKELGEAVRQYTKKGGASRMELNSFITHITR
ncbi:hypothetical protein RDI58_013967 [Solanum bulbocastanum]|uniref:Uncharacterized protein n=1 Tax=Solanum bulbocastanum TaxID=147425 RepID=A0AAN8YF60_SOLBU